jgi:hypothetical protein
MLLHDSFMSEAARPVMTDQSLGFEPRSSVAARARAWLGRYVDRAALGLRGVALATGAIALMLGRYIYLWEGHASNIIFTLGVTIALIAALTFASRRLFFSTVVVAAVLALIATIADVKRSIMSTVVHAYDLFFYLSSWSTVSFLWSDHRAYLLGALAGALSAIVIGVLAFRIDGVRVARAPASAVLVVAIVAAWIGAETKGERRHMQFNFSNLYISSFYASWAETLITLWNGQMVDALPPGSLPAAPIKLPPTCETSQKPPHIILVHQESVVPPGIFPGLRYDPALDQFFKSQDGEMRRLRVETYGGASWLTEFSILAGVSTHAFGGMRQFVQTFMQGKLKDTLPQVLERCGYRNTVFYPMLKNFVSNDRFYSSIGLKEIFDLRSQRATKVNERDRFYYANAIAEIGRHVAATPTRPIFTYIQTMAAHWPYDVPYMPEVDVPGGGPGTHPEMNEYLRRVSMAKMDYAFLKRELAKHFPDERFLIVHYGDHHPMSTRMLLGFSEETQAEDVTLDPSSLGYITYFAADGVNYSVPRLPDYPALDVPYLGTVILEAAGLPLSASHADRRRLMALCEGRYQTCPRQTDVLGFHRRLIDSGIMAAR